MNIQKDIEVRKKDIITKVNKIKTEVSRTKRRRGILKGVLDGFIMVSHIGGKVEVLSISIGGIRMADANNLFIGASDGIYIIFPRWYMDFYVRISEARHVVRDEAFMFHFSDCIHDDIIYNSSDRLRKRVSFGFNNVICLVLSTSRTCSRYKNDGIRKTSGV